ncbi:MAG TPA: ABC transporter permease [Actinomycetes bacterium]|nr:ABC transporter permease [Actinomycetes bacterium]
MSARTRAPDSLSVLLVLAVAVVLVGPILLLALFSFNDSSIIALPFEGFTTQWYRDALTDPDALKALVNSLVLASVVTPICVILGTATAWAITRFRFRSRAAWSGLVGAPLVVPWLVMGVAGLLLFATLQIDLSLKTIGAMHIMTTFPLVTALVASRLVRFERSQEEAALDLGASQAQMMVKVVLPQLAPALAASAIFAFAWSFNNFEISFFNGGYDQTFPVWVYSVLRHSENLPVVNAMSTLISVVQIAIVYLLWWGIRSVSKRRGTADDMAVMVAGGVR